MRENDLPPSTERQVPRFRTYIVFSSTGSAATDEKYHGRTMNFWSALTRSQLAPASSDRKMPPLESAAGPSTLAHSRAGLAGDTAIPMRPRGRGGRPRLAVMSVQLSPPSLLFHRPLLPPPAEKPHGKRWLFHIAAYSTRGFVASRARSIAPVESSTYSTLLQVLPPSFERNTPRIGLGPKACPIAATYT